MNRALVTLWVAPLLEATVLFAAAPPARKVDPPALDGKVFENLEWREIGPASMQGRCTDVEGIPGDPSTVYVGAASGGVWKTTNAGTTWTPIFDKEAVQSIGDMALDPANPDVVYVGTGEANLRNSVSFGDGVYKSTDGGKTWKHLGLADTEHIARIVVSPRDPAEGLRGRHRPRLRPERRARRLHEHERRPDASRRCSTSTTGTARPTSTSIPQNPNILFATMWRFERKPWTFTSGSEQSGLYRSVDGGRTWSKLEKGLPKLVGRMGVKVAPSNPQGGLRARWRRTRARSTARTTAARRSPWSRRT